MITYVHFAKNSFRRMARDDENEPTNGHVIVSTHIDVLYGRPKKHFKKTAPPLEFESDVVAAAGLQR